MRANLKAFERRRLRPRMLTGNRERDLSVDVLGTALVWTVPSRADRCAEHRPQRRRTRSCESRGRHRNPIHLVERGVAFDRGSRRGDGGRPALVPALLDQRPRGDDELRQPSRRIRIRRDRPHPRHADPRLAAPRPDERIPAVPQWRGVRSVLLRSRLLRASRKVARRRPTHGCRDDARHVPERRPHLGGRRVAARADRAPTPRQRSAHRRGRCSGERRRRRWRHRFEPRWPSS